MRRNPELIVMLTYNDHTVENAYELFEAYKDSKAKYWGIKESGLPFGKMKKLYAYMKACGKITGLEVVAYTEEACMEGAKMAVECGCDILMGTMFFDSVNEFCKTNRLKYMPFVGNVTGRPSILEGTVEEMIAEARGYLEKGVYGFDLLGYRYVGDVTELNKRFVQEVDAPVCLAGSINSFERLREVKEAAPWAFTVGGALFENKFDGTFGEQIDKICTYMEKADV